MQAFDPSGRYGATAVVNELAGIYGGRTVDYRYDLLTANNVKKADIAGMVSASISQDSSADVKRTASFTIREGYDQIDYLSDRVLPWFRLRMPDGGWVEWPLGVFLLSSPRRTLGVDRSVIRDVAAYDQLVVLSGDKVVDRYSIPAGQAFTAAVYSIAASAGIQNPSITASGLTLPVTWDYEAGTSKLTILNDLLSAMNYRSAWFNEVGTLICEPYVLPETRSAGFRYATDSSSVIAGDVAQDIDLFDVPNRFTLVVSDTDRGSFSSTFTNIDPASPTSTVSRGRVIAAFDAGQSAADQATLDALVRRTAYEQSQVYQSVPFSTVAMPFHSNADVLQVMITDLGVDLKMEEVSWSMPLQVGGVMSHTVQQIITTVNGG